jgi:hypothetical protein
MIPQDEYPEINFVGLLLGPRGNTLKGIPCCPNLMDLTIYVKKLVLLLNS